MNAVILMSRLPHPGATKTRLMPLLTPDQCAELHGAFLQDVSRCLLSLPPDTALYTAYAPEHCSPALIAKLPKSGERFSQQGATLGERMAHAFATVFEEGAEKVLLLGSDIPHIQPADLTQAFEALDACDIVFGPTFDGGYYLVGMKQLHDAIFSNRLKWGNLSVLEESCRIVNALDLTTALIAKHRDVDTPDDLWALYGELKQTGAGLQAFPEATFSVIAKYLEEDPTDEGLESAN